MAHTITFDTLAFVKKLQSGGIEQEKAEAVTEAFADVFENSFYAVATKQDISELKTEISGKFTLLHWMIGTLLTVNIGLVAGVISVLIKLTHLVPT